MIRTELAMRCLQPGCPSVFRWPCFRASPGRSDYDALAERSRLAGWLCLSPVQHYCPDHAPDVKPGQERQSLAKTGPTG